jgi:hypothetical protein
MTSSRFTLRTLLGGTAAVLATASLVPLHSAAVQGKQRGKTELSQINGVLQRAVDAKQVPGVVAMAANGRGVVYEGAFGARDLARPQIEG